ncbi:MAG: hypothetical protein ACYTKD_24410 [Planctomycetota bacterium]
MKRPTPREVAFILGGVAGVAVAFIPFAEGDGPLEVLLSANRFYEVEAPLWAAAFLVAFPVLASTVRQSLFGPLTKWEIRAAYALALATLGVTTALMLFFIIGLSAPTIAEAVTFPTTLMLAVGAGIILAATRKSLVPPAAHVHVAMLVAWMPNAAMSLALFTAGGPSRDPGYYLAAVTFVAYAVEATLRVRRALRSDHDPGAEAAPS